jgi:hypothetical protein
MGCQTNSYTSDSGSLSLFYFGESIKSSICGINDQFRNIIGGRKSRRKRRKRRPSRRSVKRN